MRGTAAVLVVLMAVSASASLESCSQSGRFCATWECVQRGNDEEDSDCFYRITDSGRPIREIITGASDTLLTDDGHYFVCTPGGSGSSLRVFRLSDGGLTAEVKVEELLTGNDLLELSRNHNAWTLREKPGSSAELVLQNPNTSESTQEVVVDVASGKLVTPKRDIFPSYRAVVRVAAPTGKFHGWGAPHCRAGAFTEAGLTPVAPQTLFDNAVEIVEPLYPDIAKKARIAGWVSVEVIVDETGEIACYRVSQLPFGADKAAENAISQWHFHRFRKGGKVLRVESTFAFEFGRFLN